MPGGVFAAAKVPILSADRAANLRQRSEFTKAGLTSSSHRYSIAALKRPTQNCLTGKSLTTNISTVNGGSVLDAAVVRPRPICMTLNNTASSSLSSGVHLMLHDDELVEDFQPHHPVFVKRHQGIRNDRRVKANRAPLMTINFVFYTVENPPSHRWCFWLFMETKSAEISDFLVLLGKFHFRILLGFSGNHQFNIYFQQLW